MKLVERVTGGTGIGGPLSLVAFVVVLLVVPQMLSDYDLFLATSALIVALMVQGIGMVTGRAGLIVLSQLGFAAVGAYVFLLMRIHLGGAGFLVAIVVAGLATAVVGLLVGLPALRLRGVNLGILTLVFGVTVTVVLTTKGFPGQSKAYFADRPDWLVADKSYFYLCGVVFALTSVAFALLDRTRLGASWLAARRSERATAALGRSVARTKTSAFALCALVAGLSGALFVGQQGTVTVESFAPVTSLIIFAVAIMMGARYPEGALLAGALNIFLPVFFDDLNISQNVPNLLFAAGAVIGLLHGRGAAEDIRHRLGRRFGRTGPELAVASADVAASGNGAGHGLAVRGPLTVGATRSDHAARDVPALEIRNLSMSYRNVRALSDVTVVVPQGCVTAVIGPNGAGKSTLIDCVTGFVRDYEGEVRVLGERIDLMPAHMRARHGIRRSFQQDRTIPELTVERYLRLAMPREASAQTSPEELEDMLAFFDGPHPSRMLASVDVGSRRVVEVVAAVAARPAVVLLDEPAAGLAAAESMRLAEQIAATPARFGPAVLLVEHDMELVQAACTEMTVLDFGEVIAAGEPREVLADTKVAKAYLGQEVMA
ncbi:MAG TPA: ATP-binding cassette domain-containing protein [Baekduia sp.]|jgi:branched-chain amino acid transport system permease protein